MKVIFLKDIPRVGKRYDVKEINDGYAMNFLLPRKLAEIATPKAIIELEKRKKEIIVEREIQEDLLLRNLEEIKNKLEKSDIAIDNAKNIHEFVAKNYMYKVHNKYDCKKKYEES